MMRNLRLVVLLIITSVCSKEIKRHMKLLLFFSMVATAIDLIVIRATFCRLNPDLLQKSLNIYTKLGWIS